MYVHEIRLQLAIRLVGHPRNEVRDLVLKDVEDMFAIKMDPLNMENKNKKTRIVNTCQILCLQCVKHFRLSEVRQSLLMILVLLQNGQKQKTWSHQPFHQNIKKQEYWIMMSDTYSAPLGGMLMCFDKYWFSTGYKHYV